MRSDLVIRNGRVVTPDAVINGGLAITEGLITAVGPDEDLPPAEAVVDARGRIVFPGAIDPHVHLGVGGTADEAKLVSDFAQEPRAAATGGITTFVTNHEHAVGPSFITTTITDQVDGSSMTLLDKAKAIGERHSVIDFRFTGLPQKPAHLDEIPRMIQQGVTTFKFYPSYLGEEAADFGIARLDWDFVYQGFERLAQARTADLVPMAMVHCEEPYICALLKERFREEGRPGTLRAWADSRPAFCEAMQIYDVGMIARATGVRVYIVHTSSGDGVDAIAYLKGLGVDIVGETCTHYLMLTDEAPLERWGKVNPPIRDKSHQDRLWRALGTGALEVIGSDDCGRYTREEKLAKDFWDAIPGFSDMAATLSLLVSEGVLKSRLTWPQLARLASANAARYYGMYPRKGALQAGSDADFIIIDPTENWTLTPRSLNYSSDFSIYDGWRITGRPIQTYVRGRLVADHGEIVVENGYGQYVATGTARVPSSSTSSAVART